MIIIINLIYKLYKCVREIQPTELTSLMLFNIIYNDENAQLGITIFALLAL